MGGRHIKTHNIKEKLEHMCPLNAQLVHAAQKDYLCRNSSVEGVAMWAITMDAALTLAICWM
eukprot:scaffold90634_cov33-Tisochrysis_lutea.AAC.5